MCVLYDLQQIILGGCVLKYLTEKEYAKNVFNYRKLFCKARAKYFAYSLYLNFHMRVYEKLLHNSAICEKF